MSTPHSPRLQTLVGGPTQLHTCNWPNNWQTTNFCNFN